MREIETIEMQQADITGLARAGINKVQIKLRHGNMHKSQKRNQEK